MSGAMTLPALVDAHVHLHPCFAPEAFLDAAARNVAAAAAAEGLPGDASGALMLAEQAGVDAFGALAAGPPPAGWTVGPTAEVVSLRATRPGRPPLILIAGRQLVSAEGLEVLALGTRQTWPEGRPAAALSEAALQAGALVVLPWGFGKWWGRRGALARRLLAADPRLCAGDNGGRPAGLPRPRGLVLAARAGRPVLPGTDPLPLAAEVGKAGRFGFVVPAGLDPERPFASLAAWLAGRRGPPRAYGRLERPTTFLARQLALRRRRSNRRIDRATC